MANPLLLDIALYLKAMGHVTGDGVDLFRDYIPDKPENIVVLYEYKGDPAVQFVELVNRSVQVIVRDKSADKARIRALAIYRALQSDTQVVNFTDTRWAQVYLRQPPFRLGQDDKGIVSYCFNTGITATID